MRVNGLGAVGPAAGSRRRRACIVAVWAVVLTGLTVTTITDMLARQWVQAEWSRVPPTSTERNKHSTPKANDSTRDILA